MWPPRRSRRCRPTPARGAAARRARSTRGGRRRGRARRSRRPRTRRAGRPERSGVTAASASRAVAGVPVARRAQDDLEQPGEPRLEVLAAELGELRRPCSTWRISPFSRSTRQWWVRVDFDTGTSIAPHRQGAACPASARTICRRIGSLSACSTPSRRSSSTSGWCRAVAAGMGRSLVRRSSNNRCTMFFVPTNPGRTPMAHAHPHHHARLHAAVAPGAPAEAAVPPRRGLHGQVTHRPAVALAASSVGFALVLLDTTVVNVALPTIRDDLGAIGTGPAVDRQRLHPRAREPAAERGRARRPPRAPAGSCSRAPGSSRSPPRRRPWRRAPARSSPRRCCSAPAPPRWCPRRSPC